MGVAPEYMAGGLLRRLASTKKGEYSVYEAEDSHRGMMAVRGMVDRFYGRDFYGDCIVGRTRPDDALLMEAYWVWMRGTHDRKIFLFRGEKPIGWSFYACYMAFNGIDWGYFNGQSCLPGIESAVQKLDKELGKRGRLRECFDYVKIDTVERLQLAAYGGNEAERVAAAYSMGMFGYTDTGMARKLASDASWRVRAMLSGSADALDPSVMETLAADPDWRVRRGLCLCASAINPWMSSDFSERQYAVIAKLLADPEFEVRVAAVEVVVHGIPGRARDRAVAGIADMPDEELRNDAMMSVLQEGAAYGEIV